MMSERTVSFSANGKSGARRRERRVWARHPTAIDSTCQPVAAETASEPEMGWPGEILAISCGGLTLSLERRFQPGTPLVIELANDDRQPARFLEAVVIHATAQDDGQWIHGCELRVKLSEEDLQAFV